MSFQISDDFNSRTSALNITRNVSDFFVVGEVCVAIYAHVHIKFVD